jgi:DMSO/TMAO reductase YedYZ molybdopterin-dependent catalytic subunit
MTRRGFAVAGSAVLAGLGARQWLISRREDAGLLWPLRRVLQLNERVARGVFSASRLSPEFPRSAAGKPRVNGQIGLDSSIDPAAWRLTVVGDAKHRPARLLTLADVKALPRVEMTTELRCIEGWSTIVAWAGVRMAELAAVTGLATRSGRAFDPRENLADALDYAALETPNGEYYVGLDMASALHPQTLLCYEMDGRPLTRDHGAPLRLVMPVKYGIKSLKQIGTIRFTDLPPADYWAERGYDWYAGL